MEPLSEHQLLILWVQLALLLGVARGLGGLMRRVGQPAVIGELAAGLVLGPSLLGRVAPDLYAWIFPAEPVQSGLILAVAWVGVALLLVVTGFETDLALLSRLGRTSLFVSAGSLLVPLALGVGLGVLLPEVLLGEGATRTTFALFMGIALAISALPVVAKILMEMGLMRRDIGQVTIAAAMANDLVGWLLLGVVSGLVAGGGFDAVGLATTIAAVAGLLVVGLTLGQRVIDAALRVARQRGDRLVRPLTVVILAMLVTGALTQAIGVEAVLGAFVAGILIGRSRYQREDVTRAITGMTNAFFAPIFFATAGLFVDLGLLLEGQAWVWALVVIAVAAVAKLGGSLLGARLGGMRASEGLAIGVGLNARGALEIVVATVALGLGVLNQTSYTIVVVMAMVTSMMAPPLLRRLLRDLEASPAEAARLEREAMLQSSVIAGTRTALLPTRGGRNSIVAARILHRSLQSDASVALLTIHGPGEEAAARAERAVAQAREIFHERAVERIDRPSEDPAATICDEAALGYGLVALGLTEGFTGSEALSSVLARTIAGCTAPMLLVKQREGLDADAPLALRRVLVPIAGTRLAQAAQEVGYTLAESLDADVDVLHVVNRPDRSDPSMPPTSSLAVASRVLRQADDLAARFGCVVTPLTRVGPSLGQEVIAAAGERESELIVMGAEARVNDDGLFLGHGVEYVLEHAWQTVAVVVFPAEGGQ